MKAISAFAVFGSDYSIFKEDNAIFRIVLRKTNSDIDKF